MASPPADGAQKPKKVLRPLHFVLPVVACFAHAAWLASLRAGVIAEFNASADGTLSMPWALPVAIGAVYVAGVILGVRVFKGREAAGKPAAQISEAMVVYNVYASLLSLYMGAGMFMESIAAGRGSFTATMDRAHGGELCWLLYCNMLSKFLEYLDTVFMIVKYNWRQVRRQRSAAAAGVPRRASGPPPAPAPPTPPPTLVARLTPRLGSPCLQITFLHVSHHAEMGWVIWVVSARTAPCRCNQHRCSCVQQLRHSLPRLPLATPRTAGPRVLPRRPELLGPDDQQLRPHGHVRVLCCQW